MFNAAFIPTHTLTLCPESRVLHHASQLTQTIITRLATALPLTPQIDNHHDDIHFTLYQTPRERHAKYAILCMLLAAHKTAHKIPVS